MRFEMEEISTGGGCEHILIKYFDLGVCVLINNDCHKVPKLGESYDVGVYNLEPEGWMGEYFEGCFETFDNFDKRTIVVRTQGYLEGKGFEKKKVPSRESMILRLTLDELQFLMDNQNLIDDEAKFFADGGFNKFSDEDLKRKMRELS